MEIKKLEDIVAWADGIIKAGGYYEEKYKSDATTAYWHVKAYELWRIRDIAFESMERHAVYTNALNNDIADKAAKIERLEEEIEGRKEGYAALKEKADKLKDEVAKLNKCIMEKNETIKTAYDVMTNLRKEISAHEDENKKLEKRIEELTVDLDFEREKYEKMAKANAEMETNMRKKCFSKSVDYRELEEKYRTVEQYNKDLKEKNEKLKGELDKTKKTLDETIQKWIPELKKYDLKTKEDDHGRAGFEAYIRYIITEEEGKFKAELNKRLSEEVSKISQKRTEEELAKVKGNGRIPCGEDAIE